ncbi:uncharacterized protein N7477_007000 [Penicillium maclennaniae]|uniref:uncharacterized protein n=1 Tax=Penicillium maclennaniae TaxID=1343394 RepID=UPI0025405B3E|nr:uncharacterized protein N7477_007000 [Penicillium maclennaniae]KAJ5668430.1 hypothetical protein N7477_007000 [Penicillium maclennaniae]
MECASHRLSFATWRLRTFRQLLATSHQSRVARRPISTSPRHEAAETKPDTETHIPPSQRLPQSPLVTDMRTGPEKQHKRPPTKADLEPLSKNPWAVALASPPRMCTLTGARIPRDLLGQWGLLKNPTSGLNYMLPVGLLQESLARDSTPVRKPDPNTSTGEHESSITPVRNEKLGRTLFLRMVDRLSFLRVVAPIFARSAGKKPAVAKMVPYRWKHPHGPINAKEEKNMVWMKDMPEYVLMHMRRDVARKLEAVRQKWGLGGEDGVWSALDVQESSDAGMVDALARLRPIERAECGAMIILQRSGAVENGNVNEVVHPQTQKKIPVFDLSKLLAESDLDALRQTGAAHYQQGALFFRPEDPSSIKAMLSLWKLKLFLEEDPALDLSK